MLLEQASRSGEVQALSADDREDLAPLPDREALLMRYFDLLAEEIDHPAALLGRIKRVTAQAAAARVNLRPCSRPHI